MALHLIFKKPGALNKPEFQNLATKMPIDNPARDHYYCYAGVTVAVATQGQVLGHRDSVRKFSQAVLWLACNS